MSEKVNLRFDFIWLLLAGLFLCNPVVAFVDILPNCIGYLFLCIGLRRLSDLSGRLYEAAHRIRVLFVLSIGYLLALYLIYGVMGGEAENLQDYHLETMVLLGSFVMLFVQWYYLIPALRDLFLGLQSLTDLYGEATWNYARPRVPRRLREGEGIEESTPAERMAKRSTWLVVFSSIFSVLPELSILTSYEYAGLNPKFRFDWYRFIELFRMVFGFLGFLVGLIWLICLLLCILRILRDFAWIKALNRQYTEEILPQTGMLTVRRFSLAFAILQIALIFAANLRLSERSILPGILLAALVLISVTFMSQSKSCAEKRAFIVACIGLSAWSLAQILISARYFRLYSTVEASLYNPDAYLDFWVVQILDAGEVVFSFLLIVLLLRFLMQVVRTHTVVEYDGVDCDALSRRATDRLHREFRMRAYVSFVLFFVAMLIGVADAIFRIEYPWLWLPGFVFSFAGIWSICSFLQELKTQIRFVYRSDGTNKNL